MGKPADAVGEPRSDDAAVVFGHPGLGLGPLRRRSASRLAVGADALLNWGNFPSCFALLARLGDSLVVDPGFLGEFPVRFLGLRRYQLREDFDFGLGVEVAAVEVLADDEGARGPIIAWVRRGSIPSARQAW